LAGLINTSVDGHRLLFVGVERVSGIIFAVPIGSKAETMRVVKEAVAKVEQQPGESNRAAGESDERRLESETHKYILRDELKSGIQLLQPAQAGTVRRFQGDATIVIPAHLKR
jgi:hypothetical protein